LGYNLQKCISFNPFFQISFYVYVLKGVVVDVSTGTIFKGVTPFWVVDIFRLALIVFVPWLVLFLPNSML